METVPREIAEDHVPLAPFSLIAWATYLFLLLPTIIVVPMSFGSTRELVFPPEQFSFELYRQYFFEGDWLRATLISFQVALISTIAAIVLGVPAAYGLARFDFPGKKLISGFLLSPMLIPAAVLAIGLYLYFAKSGVVGTRLSIAAAHTILCLPFVLVIISSAMRQIDKNLEIAASILGASPVRRFLWVTLPLLRPSVRSAALFAFLISFDEVVVAFFLSSPDSVTLPVRMFGSIKWEISPVLAAISTLLTVLSLGVCSLALVKKGRA